MIALTMTFAFFYVLVLVKLHFAMGFFKQIPIPKYTITILMMNNARFQSLPIQISTTDGIILSHDLKDHIEQKIRSVIEKLGHDDTQAVHVTVKMNNFRQGEHHSLPAKKGSQKVEVTAHMPGKVALHTSDQSDNLEQSVDKVARKLARMITKQHRIHQESVHTKSSTQKLSSSHPGSKRAQNLIENSKQ